MLGRQQCGTLGAVPGLPNPRLWSPGPRLCAVLTQRSVQSRHREASESAIRSFARSLAGNEKLIKADSGAAIL